jgi:hypothetical protein
VDQDDAWSGPVIIKSNLNHYGAPETRMLRRAILERVRRRPADISWRGAQSLPSRSYPILRSIEDVPAWAWSSPELLVEKFLPERTRDGFYGVRGWVFCGDLGYAYRVASDEPIVKPRTAARITYLKAPPEALMRRRSYTTRTRRLLTPATPRASACAGSPQASRFFLRASRKLARGRRPALAS